MVFLPPPHASHAGSGSFTDYLGTAVEVPSHPQRIVALAPSITELLFALGLGDKVVGTTEGSDIPPRAGKLPVVGSFREPNIEMIVDLNPDLVLADAGSNPPWTLRKLRGLGIPVYATRTRDPKTLPATFQKIAAVCGVAGAGRRLAGKLERQFAEVAERLEGVEPRTTLFVLNTNPVISAGKGTVTDKLITMAGGINIARDAPGDWPTLSKAFVVQADPEVVILSSMEKGMNVQRRIDECRQMPGIKDRKDFRIRIVNSSLVDRPGPRIGQGLIDLAAAIHPGRFKPRQSCCKARPSAPEKGRDL